MRYIERILVAVKEPAAASLPAVAKAAQLARAFDAELELFHAIDSSVYMGMLGCSEDRALQLERTGREHYLQRLERIAARVRLHTPRVTVATEWDYPGYEAIVRRAVHICADLIVAGSHAGPHADGVLTRPSDWDLVRCSAVPVLLVRSARLYRRPTVLAALDPSQSFAKPPELDEDILRFGSLLSNGLGGMVHAAHVYMPQTIKAAALAKAAGLPVKKACAAQAKTDFDRVLDNSKVANFRRHLLGGCPSEVLRRLACRLNADVVVVGSVARSGLERLLIGNTAERLLHTVSCDLLVVKPVQYVQRVPEEARGARVVTYFPLG